jgi:hypothetical protein
MRALTAAAALLVASACKGPPARLVVGASDTVIVNNSSSPIQLPARVLDAAGHDLDATGVRYQWTAGVAVPVSQTGTVTCTQPGDAMVRASLGDSLGGLATSVLIRCRPVRSVRVSGPVQLVLGDTARQLEIQALGVDGRPVGLLVGNVDIDDTSVAALEGLRVRPRSPGAALLQVTVGDKYGRAGVHVYERVETLDGLRPDQRMVIVPLRLGSGEMRRWRLPAGEYTLAMLPEDSEPTGLRLRIDGANCLPSRLTRRRYTCLARRDASVIVYHPSRAKSASQLTGELLVWRLGNH